MVSFMLQIAQLVIQSHIRAALASSSLEMPRESVEMMNSGKEMLQSVGVSNYPTEYMHTQLVV